MTRSETGERIVRALLERRRWVLLAFAIVLFIASVVVVRTVRAHGRLPLDNSLEIWFLEDDPVLERYREFLAEWGNDEAVVIGLFDPKGIVRQETLQLIADLSARIERLERVHAVTSLSTVTPARSNERGELEIEPYYSSPVDPAQVPAVAAHIREDPLYAEHLLAPDGKATILSVQLETSKDFDQHRKTILARVRAEIQGALRDAGRDPNAWAWGGIGVIHVAINDLVLSDSARFMVLTNLLLVVGLAIAFRRTLAVLACFLSVGAATLLLIGTYLGAGLSLNMVTMVLPTLVMVVGLTDSIYFLMTFQLQRAREPEQEVREAVVQALGFCFWPGLFNSITTSVGFMAFLSARMEVVRHLGGFAGIGVACAFLSSLTVCALILDRFPHRVERAKPASGREDGEGWVSRALARLAGAVISRRRLLLGVTVAVTALAAIGLSRLRVDSYSLGYFYSDHEIQRHDAALLDAVGGYIPLEIVVHTHEEGGVKRPEILRGLEALVEEVVAQEPGVERAISLSAVAKQMNRVLTDDPEAELPTDREALEQIFLFYDPHRDDNPVWVVDPFWETTRVQFKIRNEGARAGGELLERIHARAARHLPGDVEVTSGGYMPLYAKLISHLVWSQVTSLSITLVVVFVLIAVLFRSVRYALLSFLPNALPVAMTLGLMGFLGVRLDLVTVMVAAIGLGVAVDDTIHFLYKFRANLDETGDPEQAVRDTFTSTGRAILSTSLIVILGFGVLCLANIMTTALFGLLMCVTMFSALVAEFVVTPTLLLTFPPKPSRALPNA